VQIKPAARLGLLPPYLFAELDRLKKEVQQRGVDVISLGIGDPDLPTPDHIVARLQAAATDPVNHRYPDYEGLERFRAAAAGWYRRRFEVRLDPAREVCALIGSKEGIANFPTAVVDPGDIVLIPDPGYPVYYSGCVFNGGEPYFMRLSKQNAFLPDLAAIPAEVARDRAEGARAAVAAGAQAILLDDGLQNPSVVKTLSLLVVDAAYGFGNGRVIPAGPLRESLRDGLARVEAAVLLGESAAPPPLSPSIPILRARLTPLGGERFRGRAVVAFAGIGRPQKFFATLEALGARFAGTRAFPDHHPYRRREIEDLIRRAAKADAALVTTAKDFVRMPPGLRGGIEVLEVEILWEDPAALARLLAPILGSPGRDARDARV
jgi:tetraacyldisaccharide 4'-kinase